MANEIYWVWLQTVLGPCSRVVSRVLRRGGVRAVFGSSKKELLESGLFDIVEATKLSSISLDPASEIVAQCARMGYDIVTPESDNYPRGFLELDAPPAVLYVSGSLSARAVRIGAVGTRDASPRGSDWMYALCAKLAESGAVIVSGCARGIDTAAHTGALAAGGKTIAVLGCGIDYPYNKNNAQLRRTIAQSGALVSEYPPGTPPNGFRFPQRNRLISAMCDAVVVGQAGNRSGSLITAGLAAEQGVKVYAQAYFDGSDSYAGTQRLLHEGASPVSRAEEIISDFADRLSMPEDTERPPRELLSAMPRQSDPVVIRRQVLLSEAGENARLVYSKMPDEPVYVEQLLDPTGLAVQYVLGSMTELELLGLVRAIPGRRFEKIK